MTNRTLAKKPVAIFRHFDNEVEVFDPRKLTTFEGATKTGFLRFMGMRDGIPVYQTSKGGEKFVVEDYYEQKGAGDGAHRKKG